MCRGGGSHQRHGSGRTVEGRPLQRPPWRLCCAVHIYGPPTVPATRGLKRRKNQEPRTGGEAQCSCGAEPTQRGPRGGRGRARARDTRPRGPSGLRGSCPAAGAVPQRSEGGVFFVFVSLCVGGRGCNGRGPKTTPVRGNGRYHKACRGLRACGRVPPLFLLPPPLPPRPAFEAMTDVQLLWLGTVCLPRVWAAAGQGRRLEPEPEQ